MKVTLLSLWCPPPAVAATTTVVLASATSTATLVTAAPVCNVPSTVTVVVQGAGTFWPPLRDGVADALLVQVLHADHRVAASVDEDP